MVWDDVASFSELQLRNLVQGAHIPNPKRSKPEPDWQYIHRELKRKGVTLQLLWEEYKEQYPGGYQSTQFCELYKRWKNTINPWMRQNHKAGDKLFVDYAGQEVPITDQRTGSVHQAQVFVAVLGMSNYTYAEATWDQTLPNWIGSHLNAFAYFNGVPRLLVPDNLKAAVSKANWYDPDINPTYYEMASYYGTAVLPARVRKPKDKAKVEVAVQIVERWILAALRNRNFFNLRSLNQEIRRLLDKLNDKPFKKLSGSRRSWFDSIEKEMLLPLPATRYEIAEWKNAKVNIDYHVEFDRHYSLLQCSLQVHPPGGANPLYQKRCGDLLQGKTNRFSPKKRLPWRSHNCLRAHAFGSPQVYGMESFQNPKLGSKDWNIDPKCCASDHAIQKTSGTRLSFLPWDLTPQQKLWFSQVGICLWTSHRVWGIPI